MIITIVVAVSSNGIIGRDGDMPWRLSTDLKRFKALTLGKPVIMGRKTFQSIGRALPGRPNIVISRDTAIARAGALADAAGGNEICVIGGGEIYRQAIGVADVLHVTHVDAEVEGDTRFPAIDPVVWLRGEEECVPVGERDNYPTRFVTYRRSGAAK